MNREKSRGYLRGGDRLFSACLHPGRGRPACVHRANLGAGAALGAKLGVYGKRAAFGDSPIRALRKACPAGDAIA